MANAHPVNHAGPGWTFFILGIILGILALILLLVNNRALWIFYVAFILILIAFVIWTS